MANIKDLKDTESYIQRIKKAVVDLIRVNDFSLLIYVNDTPIDKFFRNLETLNPEDAINALRDGLSKLNFETTGIDVTENGELTDEYTTEYIDKSFINGIDEFTSKFDNVCEDFIESFKNALNTQSAGQSQVSEQSQTIGQVDDLVDSLDDLDDLTLDTNDTDSVDVAPSQQLTEQPENPVVELSDYFDGLDDLEDYPQVTTDAAVQNNSELIEPNTENSSTSDFEGKAEDVLDVIADTTGKLSDAAGEIANNADAQHNKVYDLDDFEGSDDTAIDLGNLHDYGVEGSGLPDYDIEGIDLPDYDIEGLNEAIDSLPVFNKSLKSEGIELSDLTNSLADGSNDLASTVSDTAEDLKDAYDEAVSVIKDTPSEVDNETYERQDKVGQITNSENSGYNRNELNAFEWIKGLPEPNETKQESVAKSIFPNTDSLISALSDELNGDKVSSRLKKYIDGLALGSGLNMDRKYSSYTKSGDLSKLKSIANDDKNRIKTLLGNDAAFDESGVAGGRFTQDGFEEAKRLIDDAEHTLAIWREASKEAGESYLSDPKYDELNGMYNKLVATLGNNVVEQKDQQDSSNTSTVKNTASETSVSANTDSKQADSDWLKQQTSRIQAELRKARRTVTYTSLEELLDEIDPQVNERLTSGNPFDVKDSELKSYNSAFNSAFKHIEDTKNASKTAKSKADLEKLEKDVGAYNINELFGGLAKMPEKDQISVFEQAATDTKGFSDRLAELADALPAKDISDVRKAINSLITTIDSEKKKLESVIDTTKIDADLNASKVNAEEVNKKSALSEITDEIRNAVTGYNEIRVTKNPEDVYKYVTEALKSVDTKIDTVTKSDYAKDDDTFREKAESSAKVFRRDFSGYQSTYAVAAIRQYVTSNTDSIDQLVDALGNAEKAQSIKAPDYIKDIIARSDSKSDVGRAVISKQAEIKSDKLAKDIADKQAEVDTAKERVQSFKNNNDTANASKALENLADKQRELSELYKAQGDTVKSNKALLDSSASRNEAIDIKTDVPLELQQLNKELNAKLKEIDETIANAKDKLKAQKKAILDYDKTIAASSGKYLPNENAKASYDRAKATADKRLSQTQISVYKQALDAAKSDVIHKKAVYDAVKRSDSGATTQEVQVANQEYIDSLKSLASLQEKYKDTDAVKDSDIANTNSNITQALYEAESIKTGVTREATEQLKLFEQELKQIQSDKTLSTADKAYYTQKVYQKAQDAYKSEEARKDQMDVTPEGQAIPHINESTVNAYKEFAEQAQKATTYLHQQSVEEERLAANTVQVKQQEQLISQSSNLGDKAQRTKELADLYRRQAAYAKDLAEKETLLAKAAKADADAVKLEQQAYQEFLNNVKAIGKAVADLGRSVQSSINEIVSLVRSGINVTNKYVNTTVNGTKKVFSSTQRVIQLFGGLSNRVRQTANTFFNFARQTVSGLHRVASSLANLTAKFKTVIDRGNANPLRQSWTELNSVISLAQRAFNGVFNNALLDKAIKFDSTIASITMLLGNEATNNAQEFAKALQDAFGVSYSKTISDLQEITSLLQSAGLQDVGASSEQIGKAAMDFYAMSQYLAALGMAGGSATEVMNKLQSGMKGMTQSIDDLGLSVREADMNQFLKEAKKADKIKFDVKFSELSEANKEAVRLAAILDQFRKTKNIGNFKDLLDQPYYQVSLIKSRVEEIGTMIGKIFEGIIAKFLPTVMAFLDVIQSMLERLASGLHIDLSGDKVQKSLSDISKAANTTEDSIDGAKKSAKEFDGTAGFDEIESLNSSASTDDEELNLGSLLDDVGSISGMLEKLAKDSLKQTNKVKSNFQKMINSIVGHHVDLTFGFDKALAKKQLKAIWGNIKRWWKAVKGTGLYLSVRIAEDLQVGRIVNDILRIVNALTRMGAVIAEYLDHIIKDFYEKYLSKYFKRASNSAHNFSNGMKQLADVVELIFDRKTSNSGVEKAINDLAETHPKLARIAQDLYVIRDNFSGFFAIFQDNPVPDDLLKLGNLKRQFPILTQVLSIIDAIVDLVRVLYSDYVKPLFDEIRSNFDIVDFLYGVEMKIRDLTSLLDSTEFQIIVKDNFANLLHVAKTTFENIKSIFSGALTVGASLVTPTDNSGKVTSQANGGTSVASMAVDSYNQQSTELQGFLKSAAQEASAYVTEHKNDIAGIIDTILDQIEKQLELLISIIGKVSQYLTQHPEFLERIASMVTSILDYVNKNADTILWLLDTIVGFTFDNFNNLLNSLQIIFDYISANKESVQEVLSIFTNFSGEALTSIAQIITSLFDYIAQHKEELQSLMDKVLDFLSWLAEHPGVIISVFKIAVLSKAVSVITNLLGPLGKLAELLFKVGKFAKDEGIFAGIAKGAKGIAGKAKGLFNFGKGATVAAEGAETLGIATESVPLLETTALSTEVATTAETGLATTTGAEALNVVNGGLTLGTKLIGAGSIVTGIAGGVKDAVDGVKKFTDESSTLGDKFAAGITSAVMSDESGLTGALKNGAKWGAIGAGIGTFIAPGIGTAIGGAVGSVGGAIAGAIDTQSAINKVKEIGSGIKKVGAGVKEKFGNVMESSVNAVTSGTQSAINKVKEIGSGIKEVGAGIKDQFGNSMKESVKTITSDTATIPEKVGAVVNLSAKRFTLLPDAVKKTGKKLVDAICQNEAMQKAFTSSRNFAVKLWNATPKIFGAIGSKIANAFKPMGDAIGNIFSGIKDVATGAFDFVATKAGNFVSGIFDGASDLIDKAESALGIETEENKPSTTPPKPPTPTTYTKPASGSGQDKAKDLLDSKEFKALSPSDKTKVLPILADYSMKKITKAQANAKLKKFSSSLYIRKLGGTVPAGQMFIANEPGNPEYIGKVGTHTAVANNTMITEAMETAIYNGLVDALNQRSSTTDSKSSDINVNLSGFGLIDKQTLRRLAQMLAPYFEANTKSFRTV